MRRNTSAAGALLTVMALGLASPVAAEQPTPNTDAQAKRRYQIKVMEGVLVGAVRFGAEQLGRQLQPVNPNLMLLTGLARARGFVLEEYGVFFDVEIPAMRESVAWTMRTLDMTAARRTFEQLRRQLETLSDSKVRLSFEQALRRLEAQVVPPGPDDVARTVSGASIPDEPGAVPPSAPPTAQPARPEPAGDPDALYTESVKNAIVDAMLDYGPPIGIQPDEWLAVAARDGTGPLTPFENYEAVTLVMRIRGSDLAALRADRITREEARKRVEVREF